MSTVPSPTPTQVEHPWRAGVRTGIQVFLATMALGILILPMIAEFVAQFWPNSPAIAFIASVSAILAGASLLVTRVMAIPMVNAWLTSIGLGAAPKQTESLTDGNS